MYSKVISLVSLAGIVSAGSLTTFAVTHIPDACSDQCFEVTKSVGNCVEALDTDLSAHFQTKTADYSISGNFSGVKDCLCNESAFNLAGDSGCLDCLSGLVPLSPPITKEDLRSACDNPLSIPMIFTKYLKSCPNLSPPPPVGIVRPNPSPTPNPSPPPQAESPHHCNSENGLCIEKPSGTSDSPSPPPSSASSPCPAGTACIDKSAPSQLSTNVTDKGASISDAKKATMSVGILTIIGVFFLMF